jgi:hypothetical protein
MPYQPQLAHIYIYIYIYNLDSAEPFALIERTTSSIQMAQGCMEGQRPGVWTVTRKRERERESGSRHARAMACWHGCMRACRYGGAA